MKLYINPSRSEWEAILARPASGMDEIGRRVVEIIEDVRLNGDDALRRLTSSIDGVETDDFLMGEEEISSLCGKVSPKLKDAIGQAARNISSFHRAQLPNTVEIETLPGVRCIQKPVPVSRIGLYIPGGSAPLFSTVLMLGIPAKIAGCPDVILCTPPSPRGISPEIVYAARLCGIDRIYKVGGAQAIAAMAIGTDTIGKRDKIFGPGNRYVMKAKQLLGVTDVATDMPAGPSEVMVLADGTAVPCFVAADLLSQAEHGPDSQAMLVCSDEGFARAVMSCIDDLTRGLSRKDIIAKSLANSKIIVLPKLDDKIAVANRYAPEHLIISLENPRAAADRIIAAGSIFIGNYSPESAGDYASGTNHTLPTSGWARSYSGIGTDSFMRKTTIQELSREGLESLSETIVTMAGTEGLDAHALAVKIRTK